MNKEIVSTENAPGAIGPYSQAIKAGGMVFCSGQIPIDPKTGEFVSDVVSEQTEQVLNNLSEVLKAAGSSLDRGTVPRRGGRAGHGACGEDDRVSRGYE